MSKVRVFGIASILATFTAPLQAQEPRDVLARGIKAMGGEADPAKRLATLVTFTFKTNDKVTGSGEFRYQPGKARRCDLVGQEGGQRHTLLLVLDGDKGWVQSDDHKQDLGVEELLIVLGVEVMFNPVGALPLLYDNRDVNLKLLPEAMHLGFAVQVVEVTLRGKQVIVLSFDKATGLLVKATGKVLFGSALEVALLDWRDPVAAADERTLKEAGVGTEPAALLKYLRKQVPDPEQAARAIRLVKQLGDDAFDVREKAGDDLVTLGTVAVPALERAIKDKDAEIARRAKECLDVIAKRNDNASVTAALRQVVWHKIDGGTAALLALLAGANEATAREAKAALAAIVERDGIPDAALLKALDDRDPAVRAAVAAVLGKDGGAYLKEPGRRLYVRGVKLPAKLRVTEAATLISEMEMTDLQTFNLFDAKRFAKP